MDPMLGWMALRVPDEAVFATEQPIGGGVRNRDDPIIVDAENARRHP